MDEGRKLERELPYMLPEPLAEYLHFREPDGSISSKRFGECTRDDFKRHMEQRGEYVKRYGEMVLRFKRGEVSYEESVEEARQLDEEGKFFYGETPSEHS
jgi:hypothetical protein